MTKKITSAAAAAALAAGILLAQQAPAPTPGNRGPRAGWHAGRQHHAERMATFLNLTPDQREKVKAIMTEAKQSAEPIHAQLKQGHEAMAAAVKANKTDDIDRLASSQGVLMGQLAAIHSKAFAKVYTLLTPEQRQKADQMRERMQGMFGHHMGPHGMGRQ